ncbi:putative membrane spanning protein [Borrelia duttonii CR2A]|uniref:Putative membrane spanning protein n=1 Tax=Borrelia duttonii CR2A TaxID=1432657 RepID=W6THF2_9SPIR|nr:virulence associated lipoprotein [Borrelia duttonii]ETZ17893.1 putative membrane spanning protein [Borrelia duttonii CR2A]
MKQKVFIIFILISLISLLLIACGQNGKEPVVDPIDPVEAQRRAAQEKAAREREEQEKAARERAEQEKAARERAEQEKAARERAEQEKAARERAEQEKAAMERSEQEKAAMERAEQEKAAREREEQEKAAREREEQEKAAREREEQEKAAREREEQEKAAREREEQEKAVREREEIAAIENATSVDVKAVLEKHNDENWKADTDYPNYFSAINEVFGKVPHKVDGGTEFLYNDATAGDRAKESKAARREVYLACNYFLSGINAVGKFLERLVKTPELVTKNKDKVKDFLIKIRDCAKAYYVDAHDTLQKKLSKLGSLSVSDLESLSIRLDKLETARTKLIADVVEPFKNQYSIIKTFLEDTHHKAVVQVPADDIETYWNTLSSKFNDDCNEIVRLGDEIKEILGRAN